MPIWAYEMPPPRLAVLMVAGIELVSLLGLFLCRRFVLPRLDLHEGVNDAVSGTVQAIGVFYGLTVGLIAVGVWNTYSGACDIVSREACYIGVLYRSLATFPEPLGGTTRSLAREYTEAIIKSDWPAHNKGQLSPKSAEILDRLGHDLESFEPTSEGQKIRYRQVLTAYDRVVQQRELRVDAVQGGLSTIMWGVIWSGAAISIGVGYFFHLHDPKLHTVLIALTAGFLAIVLFMLVINDKPFFGAVSVGSDSYQLILD